MGSLSRFREDAASGFADTAICICKEYERLQHTLLVLFIRPRWQCTSNHNSSRIPSEGGSDSAASPFSRLSLHLTFSFITDHQTRLEKRRNTRSKGAKEEWGGSISDAKTYPIRSSVGYTHEVRAPVMRLCTNMTASARRSWITFSRTLMTHNFLEEVQEGRGIRGCSDVARVRRYPVFLE